MLTERRQKYHINIKSNSILVHKKYHSSFKRRKQDSSLVSEYTDAVRCYKQMWPWASSIVIDANRRGRVLQQGTVPRALPPSRIVLGKRRIMTSANGNIIQKSRL